MKIEIEVTALRKRSAGLKAVPRKKAKAAKRKK